MLFKKETNNDSLRSRHTDDSVLCISQTDFAGFESTCALSKVIISVYEGCAPEMSHSTQAEGTRHE